MKAEERLIKDIFNKGRILEIPFFQRNYVWEEKNLIRFLDDIINIENKKVGFFGSIILKSQGKLLNEGKFDLIDGQQRLTTLNIFFKVLSEIHNKEDKEEYIYNENFKITHRGVSQLQLKHNRNDIEIFEAILNNKLTDELEKVYNKNKILQCYNFFRNKENSKKIENITPSNVLDYMWFVGIVLDENDDEQQIFDTINSLGVSLTTAELLKNELFNREDVDSYNDTWKKVFEEDADTIAFWDLKVTSGRQKRSNIDLLLYSFLLIKIGHQEVRVDNLFNSYKDYLRKGVSREETVKEIVEYAKIYKNNIDPDLVNKAINKDSSLERLNLLFFGLNMTTIVPYILFVLKFVKNKEERNKIFTLLEGYVMRRLICGETSKGYNNIFSSFIKDNLISHKELLEKLTKFDSDTSRFPKDVDVKASIDSAKLSNLYATVILYLMELLIRKNDNRNCTVLHSLKKYSLEHVMPKKWENNWKEKKSYTEAEQTARKKQILGLGNLTIIPQKLNSTIRDSSWKIKKAKLTEFGAGLQIFYKVLEKENWNEEEIQFRGEELCEYACEIWKRE